VLLGTVTGKREDERALHEQFSAFRGRGEWFAATPEALTLVRAVLVRGSACEPAPDDAMSQAHESESAGEPPLKTKDTLREGEQNNNGSTPTPERVSPQSVSEPGTDALALAVRDMAAAMREIAAALLARPAAAPGPARARAPSPGVATAEDPATEDARIPPPSCDCDRPMKARPGMDGEEFYGCARGPERVGGCGAQTIGVALWEASQKAKARAVQATCARTERQQAEREERMRGAKPLQDYTKLPATKEAVAFARSMAPRRIDLDVSSLLATVTLEGADPPSSEP
jgi:hypothetical protein